MQQNLKFLRSGVEMDIPTLAAILNIDPIDLFLFEKDGFDVTQSIKENPDDLVAICEYFTIYLDDLIFSDLTDVNIFSRDKFLQLKDEQNGQVKIDRSVKTRHPVRHELQESIDPILDVQKEMARYIHEITAIRNDYIFQRIQGTIEKNDLLE